MEHIEEYYKQETRDLVGFYWLIIIHSNIFRENCFCVCFPFFPLSSWWRESILFEIELRTGTELVSNQIYLIEERYSLKPCSLENFITMSTESDIQTKTWLYYLVD